jgi:hypothetical protein
MTNLFRGAPAVAYALHTAGHPAYRAALATLDHSIIALVRGLLGRAHSRIDAGQLPQAREYDLVNGLTGLGTYLMHRYRDHELLRDILSYLTRLTEPVRTGGETLPGWWATGSPDRRRSPRWEDGHAGFGMAHGIVGPLALLSTTMLRGIIVTGHTDAIGAICAWLDRWRAGRGRQAWWPEVIGRDELRTLTVVCPGPGRPSWCYGTPGIAWAQQLASRALSDTRRADIAEQALVGCLTDEHQLARIADAGLCHGWAGLAYIAQRATADVVNGDLVTAANVVIGRMRSHIREHDVLADDGFLEGAAGVELVDRTSDRPASPTGARWDTCLLLG